MSDQSQIIDLSGLNNIDILDALQKLLDQSDFSKFTLIITKKPKQNEALSQAYTRKRLATKFSVAASNRGSDQHKLGQLSSSKAFLADYQNPLYEGMQLYYEGLYQEALEYFCDEELILREELKEQAEKSKAYQAVCFHIGNCFYRLKNFQKAIEYFSRKFPEEDTKQQGQKYNNLGSCYANLDQLRLSLTNYGQALKIYSEFPEVDLSNLLNNLGMLYTQSRMYDVAEKYFVDSIEERRKKSPDSSYLLYSSYLQLGNCQKETKKYNEAISNYRLALDGFASRGFGDQTETLIQLASLYELCQKWTQALDCYEKLSIKQGKKGFLYERAAMIHRNMGNFAEYDRLIKRCYEEYSAERNQRKMSELLHIVNRPKKK